MDFKPSKTYEGLLKQARALVTLTHSQEQQIKVLNDREYKFSEKRLDSLEAALESEKEMNHLLTIELDKYTGRKKAPPF